MISLMICIRLIGQIGSGKVAGCSFDKSGTQCLHWSKSDGGADSSRGGHFGVMMSCFIPTAAFFSGSNGGCVMKEVNLPKMSLVKVGGTYFFFFFWAVSALISSF